MQYSFSGSYIEGCFGSCLCVVVYLGDVDGSFSLTQASQIDMLTSYDVENVQLTLTMLDGSSTSYTGSGTYEIFSAFAVTNRLQLDLDTGPEGEVEHFDTGWVLGGLKFPAIDATLSLHDMVCYDKVIEMHAAPSGGPANPADLNLDGNVDGQDLGLLLGAWGQCPICIIGPCPCPADLNGSGEVNGLDLAMLLAAWS